MAKDDFYIINSWMIDELNLSGIELQVFAIIWSLSRGDKQLYIAGNAHLVKMTKKTEPTIISTLKKLCEKGYIKKMPVVVNKVERNYYKAITQCTEKILVGGLKNFSGGTEKILAPNNKEIIKENIKEKKISYDIQKKELFDILWSKYSEGNKKNAVKQWNKLTDKEKQAVIDNVDYYLVYCKRKGRELKDTCSYLYNHYFEDDWTKIPDCYVVKDSDNERIADFKRYMVDNYPDLLYHRNPLTFEQAKAAFEKYTVKQTEWALQQLCERDIHQYYSIAEGLSKVIDEDLPIFDVDE